MKNPLEEVTQFFFDRTISLQASVLLGCSGGVDSIVLLDLLLKLGIKPAIAHCNFQLRGMDSQLDEEFVRDMANKNDLQYFSQSYPTKEIAAQSRISIQMAARDLRYHFFKECMEDHDISYLCTAHHADDSLETILLNLGRGTGLTGMSGIQPVSNEILRPLIYCTKEQILAYAKDNAITWREDSSNEKIDYQRNFLRHKVIPSFKENFPNFESSFSKSQSMLLADRQLFAELLQEKFKSGIKTLEDKKILPLEVLKNSSSPEGILRHWLQPYGNFDLAAILQSLYGESGRIFEVDNYQLLIDREALILKLKTKDLCEEYQISESDIVLDKPIPMTMEQHDGSNFQIPKTPNCAAFDYDKLQFPLLLRKWKKGDSFNPLGMKGRKKKLSDYFIDQKYNLFEKENTWLLLSGNDIIWIVNNRMDERYKITPNTKSVYFVRLL